jgi:hypothetical protein
LIGVIDHNSVFLSEVFEHGQLIIQHYLFCLLELDVDHLVVLHLSIVGHDYPVFDVSLKCLSLFVPVFSLVHLVEGIDVVEDGLVSDYLLDGIDPEVVA